MVRFPHANNFQVTDEVFIACWNQVIGSLDDIPRSSRRYPFDAYLDTPLQQSLEYVCRVLVPLPYQSTAQATKKFMLANSHLLEDVMLPGTTNRRRVVGARLRIRPKGSLRA